MRFKIDSLRASPQMKLSHAKSGIGTAATWNQQRAHVAHQEALFCSQKILHRPNTQMLNFIAQMVLVVLVHEATKATEAIRVPQGHPDLLELKDPEEWWDPGAQWGLRATEATQEETGLQGRRASGGRDRQVHQGGLEHPDPWAREVPRVNQDLVAEVALHPALQLKSSICATDAQKL